MTPRKRRSSWRIAPGARGPGEWADRFVKFLAWAVVLAIIGYLAWVLINHLSGQFRRIKKIYTPPSEVRLFEPAAQRVA